MTRRPHLTGLTSLRFLAALHVYLFHLQAFKVALGPQCYESFVSIGYVGVNLFFLLSGFILVYTYAGREFSLREFARSRLARIYPAYLFSLLLAAPIFYIVCFKIPLTPELAWIAWFRDHLVITMLSVLTLTQAWIPQAALGWNSVAWSLSVEAFFYLLFPLLLTTLAMRSRRRLVIGLVICWSLSLLITFGYTILQPDGVAVVNEQMNNLNWLNFVKFNPLVRLPEFVMGICCGLLFVNQATPRAFATPLILGGATLLFLVTVFHAQIPYPVIHSGLLSPAFAAIIYGLALRPNWSAFLEFRWLKLLGEASYSFYLVHALIIVIFFQPKGAELSPHPLDEQILCLMIAIGTSIGIYLGIERPARRKPQGR